MTEVVAGDQGAASPPAATETRPVRVLIVDDSFSFRQGLGRLLRREPGIQVVGRACNGRLGVWMTRRLHPDVVLMDIAMRGMDGIEAARVICAEFPRVSVIGLSSCALESAEAVALQRAGAVAYICKGTDGMGDTVIAAIRRSREQGTQDSPPIEGGSR